MRQVTAVGKIQSHESVSGFETSQEHGMFACAPE
jgi:hypothetical protein